MALDGWQHDGMQGCSATAAATTATTGPATQHHTQQLGSAGARHMVELACQPGLGREQLGASPAAGETTAAAALSLSLPDTQPRSCGGQWPATARGTGSDGSSSHGNLPASRGRPQVQHPPAAASTPVASSSGQQRGCTHRSPQLALGSDRTLFLPPISHRYYGWRQQHRRSPPADRQSALNPKPTSGSRATPSHRERSSCRPHWSLLLSSRFDDVLAVSAASTVPTQRLE